VFWNRHHCLFYFGWFSLSVCYRFHLRIKDVILLRLPDIDYATTKIGIRKPFF